ncbi:S8 family serine peptidase [Spirosoma flavum]|uniref:S8 family serine peptidase n=1 Tax=Spirosoma flavum TaxID=2048557 RepID=A0ABW6AIT5_9BACT
MYLFAFPEKNSHYGQGTQRPFRLQRTSFSNFGSSVDVCAYGVRIKSTYKDGTYATLSGTSMVAPHVTGLLFIRDAKLPTHGTVTGDTDGTSDPMAGE